MRTAPSSGRSCDAGDVRGLVRTDACTQYCEAAVVIHGARVAVTVPAFNEERLIARTLQGIPPQVDRIIVVDDASCDATRDVVESIDDPRIELVRHERNGGVGAAIVTGYKRFLAGDGDVCVVMAGDAQMDPDDLPALIEPVATRSADYAKGNRLIARDVAGIMPRDRFIGNVVFTVLTKWASGYWRIVDSQCGYTAISRRTLEVLDLDSVYPRYGFPNDLLIRLNVIQARVCDVPVRVVYGDEVSGINPWTTIPRISLLLIRGFFMRMWERYVLRDFHPLVLLYLFGAVMMTVGLYFGSRIALARWVHDTEATYSTVTLCAISLIVGFQSLLFAMMFDMIHNSDLQVRRQ